MMKQHTSDDDSFDGFEVPAYNVNIYIMTEFSSAI